MTTTAGARVLTVAAEAFEPTIDREAAPRAVRDLLEALGQDTDDPELAETRRRVAAAYEELLTPAPFELTTFANDEGYDELVIARDIPFRSLCAHHLLPFGSHTVTSSLHGLVRDDARTRAEFLALARR